MEYNRISAAIMDEHNDLVYVADTQTYELLYMNKGGTQLFGENYHGTKCYAFLQNRTSPCPFCTNHLLKQDSYYIWEFMNPVSKRYYYLKDKLMEFEGRLVRLEICTDITDKEYLSQQTRHKLAVEETLIQCIETLIKYKDTSNAIEQLLSIVGQFYQAQRAYLFEFDYSMAVLNNTYEWCQEEILPQIDNLQDVPIDAVTDWIKQFQKAGAFFITSLGKDLDPASLDYQILAPQNVESLMAAPLCDQNGNIVGFIGVDNPSANTEDISLLRSIGYFVLDDINKRKMLTDLERMSYLDELTGLSNRNRYIELLNDLEQAPPKYMGVVYVDMNGLKIANDTYGHEHGDMMLIRTAEMMKDIFSDGVFRVGGDEFIAICLNGESADFEAKVTELRRRSEEDPDCRLSIGASWNHGGMSPQEQIIYSDELMYVEKQAYYSTMINGQASHRSRLSQELIASIQNGEFVVYLQPKVFIQDGSLFGAEALVRKLDKDGGLIGPDRFISLYEAEGIIRHVDFFVLESVCKTLRLWKEKGYPPLRVSVNFSRATLMERNVVDKMAEILEKYNVSSKQIEIEVTESISKMSADELSQLSQKIMEKGFTLSLDDFGSKFSNLVILTQMDFDELKLDKSLINDLLDNPKSRVIVEHTIHMCKQLNATVSVAEGIESEQQLDMLHTYKCDVGQGYFFSRPISADQFESKFLEQGEHHEFRWQTHYKNTNKTEKTSG